MSSNKKNSNISYCNPNNFYGATPPPPRDPNDCYGTTPPNKAKIR